MQDASHEIRILLAAAIKAGILILVEKAFLQVILVFYNDHIYDFHDSEQK